MDVDKKYIEIDIFKSTVMYLSHIILIFGLVSSGLFLIDKFSYKLAVGIELAIILIYAVIALSKNVKTLENIIILKNRDFLIPLFIFLCTLPLTKNRAEMFGMGQDQGVYQTEAIALSTGNTSVPHEFEEYNILNNEQKIEYMEELIHSFQGFYINKFYNERHPFLIKFDIKNETSGVYHGNHIFSALLGLSTKMFGLRGMLYIQLFIYMLSIFCFFYAIKNLKLSNYISFGVTLLFAFSPLVLWVSKGAYSEVPLILTVTMYLYYITLNKPNKFEIILSGCVTFYFAVFHIIFLIISPIFIIINIFKNIYYKDNIWFFQNIILGTGLYYSGIYMSVISTAYYYNNFDRLYFPPYVTRYNIKIYILFWIIAFILCHFVLQKYILNIKEIKLNNWIIIVCKICIVISLLHIINYYLKISGGKLKYDIVYQELYFGTKLFSFAHLSIWTLNLFSGFVLLFVLIVFFFKKKLVLNKDVATVLPLILLFTYFVFIFGNILKKEVYYYFYYARYLSYVIPFILIMLPILIKNRKVITVLIFFSFLFMLRINISMTANLDDTRIEWKVLNNITKNIEHNSGIIIVGRDTRRLLGLPIKYITKSHIFPNMKNIEKEEKLLKSKYDNVYLLTEQNSGEWEYTDKYKKIEEFNNKNSLNRFNPLKIELNNITEEKIFELYKLK